MLVSLVVNRSFSRQQSEFAKHKKALKTLK